MFIMNIVSVVLSAFVVINHIDSKWVVVNVMLIIANTTCACYFYNVLKMEE